MDGRPAGLPGTGPGVYQPQEFNLISQRPLISTASTPAAGTRDVCLQRKPAFIPQMGRSCEGRGGDAVPAKYNEKKGLLPSLPESSPSVCDGKKIAVRGMFSVLLSIVNSS